MPLTKSQPPTRPRRKSHPPISRLYISPQTAARVAHDRTDQAREGGKGQGHAESHGHRRPAVSSSAASGACACVLNMSTCLPACLSVCRRPICASNGRCCVLQLYFLAIMALSSCSGLLVSAGLRANFSTRMLTASGVRNACGWMGGRGGEGSGWWWWC